MAHLNSHPLVQAAYEACLLIERLPASPEETAAVSAVGSLLDPIEKLALERNALLDEVVALRAELDAIKRDLAAWSAKIARATQDAENHDDDTN